MSEPTPSPLVRAVGNQLRRWREHRGLSREDVGDKTGFSGSAIGAFERGERIPDGPAIRSLDAALDAHQVMAVLADDMDQEEYPKKKFGELFRLEAGAVSLSTYSTGVIHGLLQTEAYARAVFEAVVPQFSEDEVERLLAERLARQALFAREPAPILCFVLDEAVLLRRTGGREVMREQIQYLLEVGKLKHVRISVLPFGCEEPVDSDGPMTLLETPEHRMLGYTEVQGESTLVSDRKEVNPWLHRYGMIRMHALPPADSARLIQRRLEEL
ncbi:helix-turn-helix transcriptional regulator [Streptomyces sp. SB3404]|uniref:Helix-turn-helix transcriptional regulator n=1 Tax=Streptomyces boncukensis TaxID=2711219 RepID=A0A6G4WY24_9ACTN|nr:helix-turn-helix transcriptional regulator [Streptomyces boncukensis]